MSIILTAEEIIQVRGLVDPRLIAADLSDDLITSEDILGAANDYVDRRINNPEDHAGSQDDNRAYRRSIRYYSAGLLISTIGRAQFTGAGSVQTNVDSLDWLAVQKQRFQSADDEILFLISRGYTVVIETDDPVATVEDIFVVATNPNA